MKVKPERLRLGVVVIVFFIVLIAVLVGGFVLVEQAVIDSNPSTYRPDGEFIGEQHAVGDVYQASPSVFSLKTYYVDCEGDGVIDSKFSDFDGVVTVEKVEEECLHDAPGGFLSGGRQAYGWTSDYRVYSPAALDKLSDNNKDIKESAGVDLDSRQVDPSDKESKYNHKGVLMVGLLVLAPFVLFKD